MTSGPHGRRMGRRSPSTRSGMATATSSSFLRLGVRPSRWSPLPPRSGGPIGHRTGSSWRSPRTRPAGSEVYLVSREGRKWGTPRRVIASRISPHRGRFRWSPDGRFIAYVGGRSLKIISPAGGESRTLIDAGSPCPASAGEGGLVAGQPAGVLRGSRRTGQAGLWVWP